MTIKARAPSHRHISTAFCIAALCASAPCAASGPLRGNPIDNVPKPEKPTQAAPAPISMPTLPAQAAVQARLRQRVTPRHFDVKGSHVIPFQEITAILRPLAGHETPEIGRASCRERVCQYV